MKGVMMREQIIEQLNIYCRDVRRASLIMVSRCRMGDARRTSLQESGEFTRMVSPFGGGRGRILSIISLLLLFSCTEDRDDQFPASVPVAFTASVVGGEAEAENFTPETRAAGTSWTAGDKVGIHRTSTGSLGTEGFTRYTINDDLNSFSPEGTGLYYPADGSKVRFIAFYPYNSTTSISSNKVTYTLTDQATQAKQEAVDFMYAKDDTKYFSASNPQANLTFKHKLSRVIVNITSSSSVDISALTMTMQLMPTTVTCDLTTGTPTAGATAGTTTPLKLQSSSNSVTYQAIVAPVASTSFTTREFFFSYGGITYNHRANNTYASGYTYVYNFTAYANGVVLTSMQSGSYNTGWSGDGTVRLSLSQSRISVPIAGVTNGTFAVTNETGSTLSISRSSTIMITAASMSGTTLYYTVAANTTGVTRESTITVTAGSVSTTCTVKQAAYDNSSGTIVESANCIVMTTSSTALIPISFLNDIGNYPGVSAGRDAYTKPFPDESNVRFDAKVLWIDYPYFSTLTASATGIISKVGEVYGAGLSDSYLYVQTGSYQGNAVVCITKPGTDEIIWSWHIWVTKTDRATMWIKGSQENTLNYPVATSNDYAFFPLNLGAFNVAGYSTSFSTDAGWSGHPYIGMYYQWGRKDPMPNRAQPTYMGAGLSTSGLPYINLSALTSNSDLAYSGLRSIQYPYNFFDSTDWIGTIHLAGTANNSWGYASSVYGKKSPFDPCPAGWRVPPAYNASGSSGINAWNSVSSSIGTTNGIGGRTITNQGFYPYAGYKGSTFSGGNSAGRYWGAGPAGSTSSYYLYFISTTESSYGSNTNSRYYAMPIRCILE